MRVLLGIVVALLLSVGVAWADPGSHYKVQGTNPGSQDITKDNYTGDVTLEKTGDTYKVTWTIAGDTYVGTAIAIKDILAVTYKSGKDTQGLALYHQSPDGSYLGYWTVDGSTKVGLEGWQVAK